MSEEWTTVEVLGVETLSGSLLEVSLHGAPEAAPGWRTVRSIWSLQRTIGVVAKSSGKRVSKSAHRSGVSGWKVNVCFFAMHEDKTSQFADAIR